MTTILAVYRGESIRNARLVTATSDPEIVEDVAARLLIAPEEDDEPPDAAVLCLERGRRQALRYILAEASRGH